MTKQLVITLLEAEIGIKATAENLEAYSSSEIYQAIQLLLDTLEELHPEFLPEVADILNNTRQRMV